jgi:hypothetical protein
MTGVIDQIEKLIYFQESKSLHTWDDSVSAICHHIDGIVEVIRVQHPDWIAQF